MSQNPNWSSNWQRPLGITNPPMGMGPQPQPILPAPYPFHKNPQPLMCPQLPAQPNPNPNNKLVQLIQIVENSDPQVT